MSPNGALRKKLIKAVEDAGYTKRAGTNALRRMMQRKRLRKRRDGAAGMRYWLAEFAPADAIGEGTDRELEREP